MAIKPNDCVIKIKDLVIGFEPVKDWSGQNRVPVYEPYWAKFLDHIKATTDFKLGWDAYDKHFVKELKNLTQPTRTLRIGMIVILSSSHIKI